MALSECGILSDMFAGTVDKRTACCIIMSQFIKHNYFKMLHETDTLLKFPLDHHLAHILWPVEDLDDTFVY